MLSPVLSSVHSGLSPFRCWVYDMLSPILSSVYSQFSPLGVESIRGWVPSELSPFGVESIRGWVPSGLSPFRVESLRGWVHSGLSPFGVQSHSGSSPIRDWVHSDKSPILCSVSESNRWQLCGQNLEIQIALTIIAFIYKHCVHVVCKFTCTYGIC
jgi:hypothetical protein